MAEYFDDLETRAPEARAAAQFQSLTPFIKDAVSKSEGWAKHLENAPIEDASSPEALAALPVLRKPELMGHQASSPPLGGFAIPGSYQGGRLFMSPGPVYEPQGKNADPWRAARAMFAAGFRAGDVVQNCFSYHLTPGGFIMDEGARALGCIVIPAGVGNTDQQVELIEALKPAAYCGTPDFLKVLLDKAAELGRDASSIKKALVSGGALFPSLREEYADRGVPVLQCYATADAGIIAYESEAQEGLIVDEGVILEIVRPGTDIPVAEGDVGEIVITIFHPVYPLIRFGTGDLSAVLPGESPCGRTNTRIKGWMGRADQRTKVKGMFVDPKQVQTVIERFPQVKRARLVIGREAEQDTMTLIIEATENGDGLANQVGAALKEITKLSGEVTVTPPGSLPNDGKVIADERHYE